MKVTDEMVEAAVDVLNAHGHNFLDCRPEVSMYVSVRVALEAALTQGHACGNADPGAANRLCQLPCGHDRAHQNNGNVWWPVPEDES